MSAWKAVFLSILKNFIWLLLKDICELLKSNRHDRFSHLADLGAPGELPMLGHLLPLSSAKSGIDMMNKWAWQYGPVTRMTFFGNITALLRKTESVLGPSRSFGDALASVGLGRALGAHNCRFTNAGL
ncbi:hypothetical protein BJ742DRAFT_737893 [Cladochytrium replicatum]|nr:hypothetical protein BJ742DRAFT_737893 [Cladochytrium replicatum]